MKKGYKGTLERRHAHDDSSRRDTHRPWQGQRQQQTHSDSSDRQPQTNSGGSHRQQQSPASGPGFSRRPRSPLMEVIMTAQGISQIRDILLNTDATLLTGVCLSAAFTRLPKLLRTDASSSSRRSYDTPGPVDISSRSGGSSSSTTSSGSRLASSSSGDGRRDDGDSGGSSSSRAGDDLLLAQRLAVQLAERLEGQLRQIRVREVANIMWASARLGLSPSSLPLQLLLEWLGGNSARLQEANLQELSSICLAIGTSSSTAPPDARTARLIQQLMRQVSQQQAELLSVGQAPRGRQRAGPGSGSGSGSGPGSEESSAPAARAYGSGWRSAEEGLDSGSRRAAAAGLNPPNTMDLVGTMGALAGLRDPSPAVFQAVIAPSARTLGDFKLTEVADLLRGLSRIAFHHHLRLASPPAPAPHAPNAAVNPFLTPACSRLFDSAMAIVGEEGHAAAPRVRTQLRRALLQFNWVESQQRQGATSGGDRQAEAASHGEDDSSTSSDGGGGDSGSPGSTSAGGGGDASVDGVGGGHQDISEFRRHSGVMHAAMLTCSPVRRRAFEVLRDAK
ncbi:MAG: hypothetical protein WDW38_000167 [Sanguina aurantia]